MTNVNWTALNVALCEALKVEPSRWRRETTIGLDGEPGSGPVYPDLIADVSRLLKMLAARGIRCGVCWRNIGGQESFVGWAFLLYGDGSRRMAEAAEPGQALALAAATAMGLEVPKS